MNLSHEGSPYSAGVICAIAKEKNPPRLLCQRGKVPSSDVAPNFMLTAPSTIKYKL